MYNILFKNKFIINSSAIIIRKQWPTHGTCGSALFINPHSQAFHMESVIAWCFNKWIMFIIFQYFILEFTIQINFLCIAFILYCCVIYCFLSIIAYLPLAYWTIHLSQSFNPSFFYILIIIFLDFFIIILLKIFIVYWMQNESSRIIFNFAFKSSFISVIISKYRRS